MTTFNLHIGFLILFLIYHLVKAIGQDLLKFSGKPFSIFLMFLFFIPAEGLVINWQGGSALGSSWMGFHKGWEQSYLLGVGLVMNMLSVLILIREWFEIGRISNNHFSLRTLIISILWSLIPVFTEAASEDQIPYGYFWMFIQTPPLKVFMIFCTMIYTVHSIKRMYIRPIRYWYQLQYLGLSLTYKLFRTEFLWYVIRLRQLANVILYFIQQMIDITKITDTLKRFSFGVASEVSMLMHVILLSHHPIRTFKEQTYI